MATDFHKTSPVACSFDQEMGVCVGWAAFSKKDGVDYVDAHGDHFPDAELFKAVDALNRIPVSERAINVEHAGPSRGEIVSAFALTEDFCKASTPAIETGGTYGVLVTFKPDADLLKSIKAGEAVCLSIEGKAYDVEEIAKSATGAPIKATAHKRTMRKVELTKIAVVKAGAHEGAAVAVIKSAGDEVAIWRSARIAKRAPAMTSAVNGHQHLIYDVEEPDGFTSYETSPGAEYGHSHPFTRGPDGSVSVGMADGHTHEVIKAGDAEMADDVTKALSADLAKARGALAAVLALSDEEIAYCKRLDESGVIAYLAKSDADRAALAKPVFVAKSGERFYATDDKRLVSMVKAHDEQSAELAKARGAAEAASFAKTGADKFGHLIGGEVAHTAIAKALATLDGDERKAAEDAIAAASSAIAKLKTPVGHSGGSDADGDAVAKFDRALADFAKSKNVDELAAAREFTRTDEGRRLYAAAYPTATRN